MRRLFTAGLAFAFFITPFIAFGAVSIKTEYNNQLENGTVVGTSQTISDAVNDPQVQDPLAVIFINFQGKVTQAFVRPNSPISIKYDSYSNGSLQIITDSATGEKIAENFFDLNGGINRETPTPLLGANVPDINVSPVDVNPVFGGSDTDPELRLDTVVTTPRCGAWYPGSRCGLVPACYADPEGDGPYCQVSDLLQLVNNLIAFAIYFATFIATVMFAYAGFLYVTAAGSPSNLEKAKKIFSSVLTGFVLVLVAWLVIDIILTTFTGKNFGFWTEVGAPVEWPTADISIDSTASTGVGSGGSGVTSGSTCDDCVNITAFNCKNPTSCQVPTDVNDKLETFRELLENAGWGVDLNFIITETGVNTSVTHRSGRENLDLGCRGSARNGDGTCTNTWVLSTGFWGGSRAIYETNSQADYDAKIAAGISASRLLLLGTFNSNGTCSSSSGCITAPHVSLYP